MDNTFAYNVGGGIGFDVGLVDVAFNLMFDYYALDKPDHFLTWPIAKLGLCLKF